MTFNHLLINIHVIVIEAVAVIVPDVDECSKESIG